jgi:biopolymer transport protein ExbB/TolQ
MQVAANELVAPKGRRASTDVPSWLAFALAAPLYGCTVLAAREAPPYVRELLLERGWVCHAIMIMTCLALTVLVLKAVGLRWQRRAFALAILPVEAGRITPENVAGAIQHVEGLRAATRSAGKRRRFLLERTLRTLEHFAARGDVAETAAVNSSESDADAAAVASSFSLVKVLIWAIPILGFIGTVIGISDAVGAFSQSLKGAAELDSIKVSLRAVTTGLALAFDTTLVALVASILVMLPTSRIQQAEERLVDEVDDFCVTRVLRTLSAPIAAPAQAVVPSAPSADDVRAAIQELLAPALAGLMDANAKLMTRLSEDREALRDAQTALREQLGAFAVATRHLGPSLERVVQRLGEIAPKRESNGHSKNGHLSEAGEVNGAPPIE